MSSPSPFDAAAYDFPLPEGQIAQRPAARRHGSRLLTLDRATGEARLGGFPDLLDELGPGDCLVRNLARVDKARLRGVKAASGGAVEVLLLTPEDPRTYRAMVRRSKRIPPGTPVRFGSVEARVEDRLDEGLRRVRFADEAAVARAREEAGELPLPPYISARDHEPGRYQTTYARAPGSVAAPTAGLHFEEGDFAGLRDRGVRVVDVVLHVGAGTFQPMRAEDLREHVMHSERFSLAADQAGELAAAKAEGRRIIAVGTTSMRVLESLPEDASWHGGFAGETDLFITPGYRFRHTQGLVTNFHLPRSTLLVLVAAFAGYEPVMRAYRLAIDAGLRFYSFGDCCWIR